MAITERRAGQIANHLSISAGSVAWLDNPQWAAELFDIGWTVMLLVVLTGWCDVSARPPPFGGIRIVGVGIALRD
jgi:hypothetical protein